MDELDQDETVHIVVCAISSLISTMDDYRMETDAPWVHSQQSRTRTALSTVDRRIKLLLAGPWRFHFLPLPTDTHQHKQRTVPFFQIRNDVIFVP